MILRKPYKFFIKNFRIIHFILAIISGYLLIKTNAILTFFNEYLKSTETLVGSGTNNEYFSGIMIFLIIIMLLGTAIILIIMKIKNKPTLFYVINMMLYIIAGTIYIYDSSIMKTLEINAVDIRTIKLASDFTLICFLVQTLSTIILTIRAIGFNLNKFNFDKDLELEISENDNEEFEFDVNIDKNKLKRNFKKNIRNIRYAYSENKTISNIFIALFIVIIGIGLFLNYGIFNKVYQRGNTINTKEYTYSLVDSYLINKDYKGNIITDNYLVVAKIRIKNNTGKKLTFQTGRLQLHIGKTIYNPITTYKNEVIDLGETYNKKEIGEEFEEYIITFEIPRRLINKKMILSYLDLNDKKYNIKLNNKTFDEKLRNEKAKINEYIKLNDDIYKKIKFKISNYEIDNKIKATYNFCETKDKCYESYEYIVPNISDNYNKTILKIESDIDFKNQKIKNFNDLSDFIETYGKVKYKVNNKEKEMRVKEIHPTKSYKDGVYYFEVYEDIKNATNISIILNIRNKKYEYILK